MLNDVEFREVHEVAKVDKVKIVACDGKSGFTPLEILLSIAIKIVMKRTCILRVREDAVFLVSLLI
jgi:hypothetical protein